MKTKYRILWVDDTWSTLRGDVRDIKNFLNEHHVSLELKKIDASDDGVVTSDVDFLNFINDEEVDFILVDLNMPNINGLGVIEFIRTQLNDYYTPIVFYTNDNANGLPELVKNKNQDSGVNESLDGIFYCHREHIFSKLHNLIKSKLNRENKIKAVRGMIIENVSDIDVDIIHSLKVSSEQINDAGKAKVLGKVKNKFRSKRNTSKKAFEDNENASYEEVINYILENPRKTDQQFRAEVLREILKYTDNCQELSDTLLEFYKCEPERASLSSIRNKYAHQTDEELQSSHSGKNNLFIKAEVRRHKENMNKIKSLRNA